LGRPFAEPTAGPRSGESPEAVLARLERIERAAGAAPPAEPLCAALGAELGRPVRFLAPGEDGSGLGAFAVAVGGERLGWLEIGGAVSDGAVRDLAEQAAALLAVALAAAGERAGLYERRRGALLADLLAGDLDRAAVRGRALGVDVGLPLAVGFVAGDPAALAAAVAASGEGLLATAFGDGAVAVWPGAGPAALAALLAVAPGPAAVAPDAVAAAELVEAVAAARAEALAPARGVAGRVDETVAALARAALAPAADHDRRRGELLVPTLRAYLAAGGNVSEAARRVGVHVNTLRYRLGRLGEIGVDLDDPEVRFAIDLALRLEAETLWGADELATGVSSGSPQAPREVGP